MSDTAKIMSKVLVHEMNTEHIQKLKVFFKSINLIGLKAENFNNIQEVLHSNIDLEAIFLCEESDEWGKSGYDIALEIHKIRPELPVFVRQNSPKALSEFLPSIQRACAGVFRIEKLDELEVLIEKYLFNTYYPSAMIHGIEELSENALKAAIKNVNITVEAPYLVKDQIIYGELFSLIPLEGGWCRGFMMLQAKEEELAALIRCRKTSLNFKENEDNFRAVNNLMSEITNMIWGGFKSRFFYNQDSKSPQNVRIQVPTIVNHSRNYISFVTENPQLCFRYVISDDEGAFEPIPLYQKFIFHLEWSPEEFQEPTGTTDDLVEAGELELF